jgi:hypothetical protein
MKRFRPVMLAAPLLAALLVTSACSGDSPALPSPGPAPVRTGAWSPSQLGLVAATGDPATMPSTPGVSPGVLYVNRVYADQSVPTKSAYTAVITGGEGLTNSYLGVYDPATGQLLASTADVSAALQTSGAPKLPLTSAVPAEPVGKELWIVLLVGGMTKSPALVGGREYGTNLGQSGDYRLWTSSANNHTSLPAAIPELRAPAHGSIPFVAIGP